MVLINLAERMMDGCFAAIPRSKPPAEYANQAFLIAHRGAHDKTKGIIENTLTAFRAAKELGCWGIEFDVQATADGILVVNHDPTLDRLWNHSVTISQLSFNELRALEPNIPSLAEVVAEFGTVLHLFIELKIPVPSAEALAQTLKDLTPIQDYHLLTLDLSFFKSLASFPKPSLLLVAGINNVKEFCTLSLKEQYGGVMGSYLLLTKRQMLQLKQANQATGVGFVDSKNSLYRELNRGVQWLFTNKAFRVSSYLAQLHQS